MDITPCIPQKERCNSTSRNKVCPTLSNKAAVVMLLQQEEWVFEAHERVLETGVLFIQSVRGNYEGFTKCEVTKSKETC